MELKVNPVTLPEQITFNYAELKAALIDKIDHYSHMVYTDEQITLAKTDRAALNRLKKALNDERIKREKEYMQPFAQFKAQVNEIISIIDKPAAMIDAQVKKFEQQRQSAKMDEIIAYWNGLERPSDIRLAQLINFKWLNASVSMKTIQAAIDERLEQIAHDIDVVRALPAYAYEAEQVYISSLDLAKAVNEAHRLAELAERKAAYEAEQARKKEEAAKDTNVPAKAAVQPEEVARQHFEQQEPSREWIGFQALLSVDEARALCQFFKEHDIKYKAI